MAYATKTAIKEILQIADSTWDTEIDNIIVSTDALVDSLLKREGLTVPVVVPQNIKDASNNFGAWLFRRRRDPAGAEAFWVEANRFLQAYIDAEKETVEFRAVSA